MSKKTDAEKYLEDPYSGTWIADPKPVGKNGWGETVFPDGSKITRNIWTDETKVENPNSIWRPWF